MRRFAFLRSLAVCVLLLSLLLTACTGTPGAAATTAQMTTTDTPTTLFDVERIEEVLNRFDKSWVNSFEGDLTDLIIEGILLASGDVYANYMDREEYKSITDSYYGNFVGIGVSAQWVSESGEVLIYSVIPGSPAEEVGFQPYDVIVAVNGERLSFAPGESGVLDRVGDMIRGEAGSYVDVTVRRNGEEIVLHTERRQVIEPTVYAESVSLGGMKTAFIRITGFDYTTPIAFKEAIDRAEREEVDMLILDLRNNPGGLLSAVSAMLTYLVPNGALLCTTEYREYASQVVAGEDTDKTDTSATPSLSVDESGEIRYNQAYADHTLTIPTAVLINSNSASAAELFTSVLRDYKLATTVGETSYGKGCMQTTYRLSDGYALKLTVAYYTPPCGVNYDKTTEGPIGITPDHEVIFSDEEKRQNLYLLEHTRDRQFVAAFNALTKGEPLPMPDGMN